MISKALTLVNPLLLQQTPCPAFTGTFTKLLGHKVVAVALKCILSHLKGYGMDWEQETRLHFCLLSLSIQVRTGNCSLMSSLSILISLQMESDLFISGGCSFLVMVMMALIYII